MEGNKRVTHEIKKAYMGNLLETIQNISDLDYQQKVWVEASLPNIVDCFEETICAFFDDANIDEFLKGDAYLFGFSREQFGELKKLRDLLDVYSEKKFAECDPPESYSDP